MGERGRGVWDDSPIHANDMIITFFLTKTQKSAA